MQPSNPCLIKAPTELLKQTTKLVCPVDYRVLKVQVWEHAALQSEFMVGHQSSDDFDPELCYR